MNALERKRYLPDKAIIPAFLVLWLLLIPPLLPAAELSIIESVQIDFGSVVDGSGTVRLGLNDLILSDPAHIHLGGFSASGIYEISGDPDTAIQVNITAPQEGGLKLSGFITSEGVPPLLSTDLGGSGELELLIGADLTVDAGEALPGLDQSVAFTISVVYN